MKIHLSHAIVLLCTICTVATVAQGQFACTFSGASDEGSCTQTEDDADRHCVWCALNQQQRSPGDGTAAADKESVIGAPGGAAGGDEFGVCVSESQAETMEQTIPDLVRCDRYDGGTDDAVPPPEDDTPVNDDAAPPASDDAPATDDGNNPDPPSADDDRTIPDDYWTCLKLKDPVSCEKKNCTWCDTPVGFGVCMTGPSADAASTSKWFTCHVNGTSTTTIEESMIVVDDPITSSAPAGTTTTTTVTTAAATAVQQQDPMDPSCALVYLQDPSQEACEAAVDANGNPCEFCTLQGAFELCLNIDQAAIGEQYGLECGEDATAAVAAVQARDPMDPSCALVYLQDPSQEACEAAVDANGDPCEFCNLQGAFELCLNTDQAAIGEQYGLECGEEDQEGPESFAVAV